MPDNRNHKRPIQIKFFVDEAELGLIKARMAQLGIENMTSYLRKISASIHSRGRTAKSGTGVTEITPVPQKPEFCFLSTIYKRPFGLFFFCPYIANIVMPCKPLIFTLNAPLRAVKICPSSETSVCAPETSALVR